MAKTIDPQLIETIRGESERTKDDPYPEGATFRRPNRERSRGPGSSSRSRRSAQNRHGPLARLRRRSGLAGRSDGIAMWATRALVFGKTVVLCS